MSTPPATVGAALEARLGQLGVLRVYGSPLGRIPHVPVADPDLAVLLADADGRIGHADGSGRLGAAYLDGPILHLSSRPGGTAALRTVSDPADLFDVLTDVPGLEIPDTSALHLDLDLDQPFDPTVSAREPARAPVVTLDPAMASLRLVIVAGPGVVRAGRLAELRELARRGGWGVINTFGARGVERWDSPFNFATVGLQERDLELSGLAEADVVVATGVDPAELPADWATTKLVQHVPPRQLEALISTWPASRQPPERPPHHDVVSGVLVPEYESDGVPLSAPRAALHLSGAIPDGGVVVADPGAAGFWLARSFPTSVPESLCVPATATPGFATAAAFVCALEGRPCVAVVDQGPSDDEPIDETSAAVLALAERHDAAVALQLWGPRGDLSCANEHVELTRSSLATSGVRLDDVPVATERVAALEAALGAITAWGETR